jgi:hypothetical protein
MATAPPHQRTDLTECNYQHHKLSNRLCILRSRGSTVQVYLHGVKLWARLAFKDQKLPMDHPQKVRMAACHHQYDLASHLLGTQLATGIQRRHLHHTT